jgi:hypothetical protein
MGWNIKHTVGLAIDDINGTGGRFDSEMKELLQDTDRLDKRIAQIQTGWLEFSLLDLSAIVASRSPDKSPIPRISANVEPYTFLQLRHFLMLSGADLYQLHLYTQPVPSVVTPLDLHRLAPILRTQCPKLVDLRLSIDFVKDGKTTLDKKLDLPPSELIYGTGRVRKLTILAYNAGYDFDTLRETFSLNLARNLACILAPDFELDWRDGPTISPPDIVFRGMGLPLFGGPEMDKLPEAIRFFQR